MKPCSKTGRKPTFCKTSLATCWLTENCRASSTDDNSLCVAKYSRYLVTACTMHNFNCTLFIEPTGKKTSNCINCTTKCFVNDAGLPAGRNQLRNNLGIDPRNKHTMSSGKSKEKRNAGKCGSWPLVFSPSRLKSKKNTSNNAISNYTRHARFYVFYCSSIILNF